MTAISDRTAATTKSTAGVSTDKPVAKPRPGALAASGRPTVRPPAAAHLSDEQVAELGRELDAIKDEILAKRGASDAAYIRRVIKIQRGLEIAGRAALLMGRNKAAWVTGTALLSAAKILENMEIGHNILHGQWDWMQDPEIHSSTWEWDNVCPAEQWKHSHNVVHHTWTNVIGKDRDVGYEILYTPHATLHHHESVTKVVIAHPHEIEFLRERWGHIIDHDPYYSPNLTRQGEDARLNMEATSAV